MFTLAQPESNMATKGVSPGRGTHGAVVGPGAVDLLALLVRAEPLPRLHVRVHVVVVHATLRRQQAVPVFPALKAKKPFLGLFGSKAY